MKRLGVPIAAVLLLAACTSDTGPSLDQQQQAWEEDVERNTCEMWHEVGEEYITLQQSLQTLSGAGQEPVAEPRLQLSGCSGTAYGRLLHERLQRQFPDSPKGLAGETTIPQPR